MTQCFLGIDTGGTQIRSAGVDRNGRLASSVLSRPTGKGFDRNALIAFLKDSLAHLGADAPESSVTAVGMGITGLVSYDHVSDSDFLPLLNDVNLVEAMVEATGLPAALENDARCFVLAEARFGAGRGLNNVAGITLGTGVGGGVIVNGQLIRGAKFNAGEIWEIPLRGKWLEYFVSTVGLIRVYGELGGREVVSGAADIARLARNGDPAAITAFTLFADDLWILCRTLRAVVDPDVVVIGGSIAQAQDVFGEDFARNILSGEPPVAWAKLGPEAGLIGAASLVM